MIDFLHQLLGPDLGASGLIILNLFVIESLLSVDNAAVLATMVMDLPKEQRKRALKYGIIGAYVFRGVCLVFASYLIQVQWLKLLGGLYLFYLCFDYFKSKSTASAEDDLLNKQENKLYKMTVGAMGHFWSTVVLVEVMDLAFSIDNVFAAVAFTDNLILICIGVFIGILAMRFVAQSFVNLMEKFPFLETVAFLVIGILGVKLSASFIADYFNSKTFKEIFDGHSSDLYISITTVSLFLIPIITSLLFNFPKRGNKNVHEETEVQKL